MPRMKSYILAFNIFIVLGLFPVENSWGDSDCEEYLELERDCVFTCCENNASDLLNIARFESVHRKISEIDKGIQKFTESNNDKLVNIKIKNLEDRIDDMEFDNDIILVIAGLIFAIATIIASGGIIFSVRESSLIVRKTEEALTRVNEAQERNMIQVDDANRSALVLFDQFERIRRINRLLDEENFDHEQFYADMSQLVQHPNVIVKSLAQKIINNYGNRVSSDIIRMAQAVLTN